MARAKSGKSVKVKKPKKSAATSKSKAAQKPVSKPAKSQVAAHGHLVSVHYKGMLSSGEVFDSSDKNGPIQFVLGSKQVIKGFDDAIHGMKLNEKKKVQIPKEHAYGDVNAQLMQKVPLSKIPENMRGQLKVGGFLVMQSPTGQQIPAKIHSLDKDNVTLDLNHPLAGKDLTFEITLVGISNAPPTQDGCSCNDCGCGDDCKC